MYAHTDIRKSILYVALLYLKALYNLPDLQEISSHMYGAGDDPGGNFSNV